MAWWRRINPLSKIIVIMLWAGTLLISLDWVSSGCILLVELGLVPWMGLSWKRLAVWGWPLLLAALVGAYATALLAPKTGTLLWDGPLFALSSNSALLAAAVFLRSLALSLPGMLFVACTPATALADALAQRLKLPARFVVGAFVALRLVSVVTEEWRQLTMARRARGLEPCGRELRHLRARMRNGWDQALALIVLALRRAGRISGAMEARAFGAGVRTWARPSPLRAHDAWVVLVGAVILVCAVSLSVGLGAWHPVF